MKQAIRQMRYWSRRAWFTASVMAAILLASSGVYAHLFFAFEEPRQLFALSMAIPMINLSAVLFWLLMGYPAAGDATEADRRWAPCNEAACGCPVCGKSRAGRYYATHWCMNAICARNSDAVVRWDPPPGEAGRAA